MTRREAACYPPPMDRLRARVKNGRLVLNEMLSLPEGTILDLVLDDEGDDLSPDEHRRLDAAIARAWASAKQGKLRPAKAVLHALRGDR